MPSKTKNLFLFLSLSLVTNPTITSEEIFNPNKKVYKNEAEEKKRAEFFRELINKEDGDKYVKYLKYFTENFMKEAKIEPFGKNFTIEFLDNIVAQENSLDSKLPLTKEQIKYHKTIDALIIKKLSKINSILLHLDKSIYNTYLRVLPYKILDQLSISVLFELCKNIEAVHATQNPKHDRYCEKPNIHLITITENSLKEKDKLDDYVKCDVKSQKILYSEFLGWMPYRLYAISQDIQKTESDFNIMSTKSFNKWGNKFILEGPQGNDRNTSIGLIADASEYQIISTNYSGFVRKSIQVPPLFPELFTNMAKVLDRSAEELFCFKDINDPKEYDAFEEAKEFVDKYMYKKSIILISDEQFDNNNFSEANLKNLELKLKKLENYPRIYVFICVTKADMLPKTLVEKLSKNIIKIPNPNANMRWHIINDFSDSFKMPLTEEEKNILIKIFDGKSIDCIRNHFEHVAELTRIAAMKS